MTIRVLLGVSIILIFSIVTNHAIAADKRVYDRKWDLKYRITDDGRIYDRNWNLKGRIKDGKSQKWGQVYA